MKSAVDLKDFDPSGEGEAWILNGLSVDATNETNSNNIKVVSKKFEIKDKSFQFTFEPHSLTAVEVKRKK